MDVVIRFFVNDVIVRMCLQSTLGLLICCRSLFEHNKSTSASLPARRNAARRLSYLFKSVDNFHLLWGPAAACCSTSTTFFKDWKPGVKNTSFLVFTAGLNAKHELSRPSELRNAGDATRAPQSTASNFANIGKFNCW